MSRDQNEVRVKRRRARNPAGNLNYSEVRVGCVGCVYRPVGFAMAEKASVPEDEKQG